MLLEQIVCKQRDQIALRNKVRELAASRLSFGASAHDNGKVIGLRIPDDVRLRIERAQERHGIRNYTQALSQCVALGLEAMELADH